MKFPLLSLFRQLGLIALMAAGILTFRAQAQDTAWCMNCDVISNAIRESAAQAEARYANAVVAQESVNDTRGSVYFDSAKGIFGRSWNYPSLKWKEAGDAAENACHQAGGVDCQELLSVHAGYHEEGRNQCGLAFLMVTPGSATSVMHRYGASLQLLFNDLTQVCTNLGRDKIPSQCKFMIAHCTYPYGAGGSRPMQDSIVLPKPLRDIYSSQLSPHQWAAIQLSKERRKVGYGVGATSAQAQAIAEKQCGVRGSNRRDCYSVGLYRNSCAAQSYGKLGAKGHFDHTSIKPTEAAAKADAMAACQKGGAQECTVYYSNCVHD